MKFILPIVAVLFLFPSFAFAQEAVSTWDNPGEGLAGWEKASLRTGTEYRDTGGNPAGYILIYGNGNIGLVNKQPEFTGDYIQKNYNNISVDINVQLQQMPNFKPKIKVRYSPSFGGWEYELTSFTINSAGTWQHFDVYFDPSWSDEEAQANGWVLLSGGQKSFHDTMLHVWAVYVATSYPLMANTFLGIDNFRLSHVEPPAAEEGSNRQTPGVRPLSKPLNMRPKPPVNLKKYKIR